MKTIRYCRKLLNSVILFKVVEDAEAAGVEDSTSLIRGPQLESFLSVISTSAVKTISY